MRTTRKRHAAILVLALILAGVAAREDAPATTTMILVRHAEKADASRDPDLSEQGAARAAELARVLADVEIHALYASQYRRTAQTLQPLAALRELRIEVFPVEGTDVPAHARRFAGRLLDTHAGETVLVAGHSNTLPPLIEALGVSPAPRLDERDYDDLFVVVVTPGDGARLLHLHYGTAQADETEP